MGGKEFINPVRLADVYGEEGEMYRRYSNEIVDNDGDWILMYCRVVISVYGVFKQTPPRRMLFAIHLVNMWGGQVYSNGEYVLVKSGLYFYDLWGKYPVTWLYIPPIPGFRDKYKIKSFKPI